MIYLFVFYFGRLPNYFPAYLESVQRNKCIHVIFITDCVVPAIADNVTVKSCDINDVRRRLGHFLRRPAASLIPHPRKLCDVRVVSTHIYADVLSALGVRPEDHVGFGDVDVIYGNIDKYYSFAHGTMRALQTYEVIGLHGHFCCIRYSSDIWKKMLAPPFVSMLQSCLSEAKNTILDEGAFRAFVMQHGGLYVGALPPPGKWQCCMGVKNTGIVAELLFNGHVVNLMSVRSDSLVIKESARLPSSACVVRFDSNGMFVDGCEVMYMHLHYVKNVSFFARGSKQLEVHQGRTMLLS